MRIIGGSVVGLLAIAVVAEGAFIIKTRRELGAVVEELEHVRAARDEGGIASYRAAYEGSAPAAARPVAPGRADAPRLPPPRFTVPAATAPGAPGQPALPPALDNPETRDALRGFIAAELERERQERRDREQQRREQEEQRRNERVAQQLGLNPAETQRFGEVLASAQTNRRALIERIQQGQIEGEAVRREFQALREKTDQELKQLLGDDRMKKLQELQRQDRRGGGPWGGGRGPRGGGPGGGGPGQGGPPGGPGQPAAAAPPAP